MPGTGEGGRAAPDADGDDRGEPNGGLGLPKAAPFGGRLRLALLAGGAALLVVGVFALVGRVAGFSDVVERLEAADPVWLAACLGSQIVWYAASVVLVRTVAAAEGGPVLPPWLAVRVGFAALGATRLLAAGGAGGLAVVYWALRRAGRVRRDAAVRVLALNTLVYGCFGAFVAAAAALSLAGLDDGVPRAMAIPWVAGLGALAALALWTTASGRAERLGRPGAGSRVREAVAVAIAGAALARRLAVARAPGALAAPAYWLGDIACLWAGLRAFDVELAVTALVLAYATGFLANLLPIPTGGVGGVDAATTFALTAVGVPLASALLGVFVYRFFSFLLPTVPALLVLPGLPRVGRELAEREPCRRLRETRDSSPPPP